MGCKFNFIVFLMMGSFVFSDKPDRFVSIGGCVTETLFAIGAGEKIVAVDQSSTLPEIVKDLPQVGYIRSISSEGILSMLPTQIFTTTDIGPPNVITTEGSFSLTRVANLYDNSKFQLYAEKHNILGSCDFKALAKSLGNLNSLKLKLLCNSLFAYA